MSEENLWLGVERRIVDWMMSSLEELNGVVNIDEPTGGFVSMLVSSREGMADAYLITIGPDTARPVDRSEAARLHELGWKPPDESDPQFHLHLESTERDLPALAASHAVRCLRDIFAPIPQDIGVSGPADANAEDAPEFRRLVDELLGDSDALERALEAKSARRDDWQAERARARDAKYEGGTDDWLRANLWSAACDVAAALDPYAPASDLETLQSDEQLFEITINGVVEGELEQFAAETRAFTVEWLEALQQERYAEAITSLWQQARVWRKSFGESTRVDFGVLLTWSAIAAEKMDVLRQLASDDWLDAQELEGLAAALKARMLTQLSADVEAIAHDMRVRAAERDWRAQVLLDARQQLASAENQQAGLRASLLLAAARSAHEFGQVTIAGEPADDSLRARWAATLLSQGVDAAADLLAHADPNALNDWPLPPVARDHAMLREDADLYVASLIAEAHGARFNAPSLIAAASRTLADGREMFAQKLLEAGEPFGVVADISDLHAAASGSFNPAQAKQAIADAWAILNVADQAIERRAEAYCQLEDALYKFRNVRPDTVDRLQEVIKAREQEPATLSVGAAPSYWRLVTLLRKTGRNEEAEHWRQRGLPTCENHWPEEANRLRKLAG